MLKNLFIKIQTNAKNYSKEELKEIDNFLKDEIIIKNPDNHFEINSKYKIALVKVEKNFSILEDLILPIKNIKIESKDLNGAYNGDLVVAKRIFNPRSKSKAQIIRIINSKQVEILVYVKDGYFNTVKENIKLNNKKTFKYNDNDILIINSKTFEIIKNVGNINEPKIDEFISLYLHKELYRLDDDKLEIHSKMDDKNKRVDLRNLPFCTIDPNSAKDHDDAIYFDAKENILYVAIADVSFFVKEGSKLDMLAFKKSTSIYLPNKVLPMLPSILSEQMCSLKEGEDRYSYIFKLHLDLKNISVKKSELFEGIIKSHKNFSYGRIDRVLKGKFDICSQEEKYIFDYLDNLYKITKSFRQKRLEKGYEFRTTENRLKLKNNEIESIQVEVSTPSHQLVEECMLLANVEASKKVSNISIYRVHDEPSFKSISKLVDDVNILGLNAKLKNNVHDTILDIQKIAKNYMLSEPVDELIIQAQNQAKYSSKNLGHFGLGFKSYSHFTSPIRRYSDLVLHRILKTKQIPKNIDDICEHISLVERKVDQLVWDLEDRKYARWAFSNIGCAIKVKIVDTQSAKAICYEKMIGLKVVLENYKGQKLFSKIKVKIISSDIISKIITASIL